MKDNRAESARSSATQGMRPKPQSARTERAGNTLSAKPPRSRKGDRTYLYPAFFGTSSRGSTARPCGGIVLGPRVDGGSSPRRCGGPIFLAACHGGANPLPPKGGFLVIFFIFRALLNEDKLVEPAGGGSLYLSKGGGPLQGWRSYNIARGIRALY